MGWIVSAVLAVVVCGAAWFIGNFFKKHGEEADHRKAGSVARVGAVLIFSLWVGGTTVGASFQQIPAGNIGVVYEFGAIVSQLGEGFQTVAPWRRVQVANIQVQRHVFNQLECFSQETQTVYVRASLNVSASPEAIQQLYRTVGPGYFQVLVEPRVNQNFKDEIVKYKSVDIAPNREGIRRSVRERLEKELSNHSIKVEDLLLDNIDFSKEFETAIEAKQIATQRALEEQQKVVVERHRAEQVLERAKGEGNAILAVAEKQAEANHKLSESLTPEFVQYALIQKLSDKIEVMILPAGQNFILSPEALKRAPGEKEKK